MFRFVLLFLTTCITAQNLQTDLETVFTQNQLMGMSVYVKSGNTEGTYNYGLRNLALNLAVDNDTKYRIASVSKSFTALGLMKLYDQNLFELDEDISTYLGYVVRNPNYPAVPITFRMLLSHTSSLQDGSGYTNFLNATYSQMPIPNVNSVLVPGGSYYTGNMWRNETPGTFFTYSNMNFGLIGTLIEKLSNTRFDVFIKNNILIPLGISGSYNIQDVDINTVATIYRNNAGWTPQSDNYNGVMPPSPDLSNYVIGSNGVYFAPQGGLRVSVSEIAQFLEFIKSNGSSVPGIVETSTLELMKEVQWEYNGSNGDNYYGLFNKWALGLHFANTNGSDFICNQSAFGNFIGHTGEAYGLISDAFYSESGDKAFVFVTNGSWNGFQTDNTSFYTIEDEVFEVLCNYFEQPLSVSDLTSDRLAVFPNPAKSTLNVRANGSMVEFYELTNMLGAKVLSERIPMSESFTVDIGNFQSGIYYLKAGNKTEYFTRLIIKE